MLLPSLVVWHACRLAKRRSESGALPSSCYGLVVSVNASPLVKLHTISLWTFHMPSPCHLATLIEGPGRQAATSPLFLLADIHPVDVNSLRNRVQAKSSKLTWFKPSKSFDSAEILAFRLPLGQLLHLHQLSRLMHEIFALLCGLCKSALAPEQGSQAKRRITLGEDPSGGPATCTSSGDLVATIELLDFVE